MQSGSGQSSSYRDRTQEFLTVAEKLKKSIGNKEGKKISSLDFHRTDDLLVTASEDDSVRLFDTANAKARIGLQIVHSQSSRTQLNLLLHMLDRVRALNKREMIELAQNAAEFVFADDEVKKVVKEICKMLKDYCKENRDQLRSGCRKIRKLLVSYLK